MSQHIIVIDDDEKICSMLRRGLVAAGYTVEVALDGQKGLERVLASPPDLVILDVMLPGLDGLTVCRRLRENTSLPILMLTARDGLSDRVTGLDIGADDYLVKPFALDELFARIRALLRRGAPVATVSPGVSTAATLSPVPVLRFNDITLDTVEHAVHRGRNLLELTVKEFELLQYLLTHPHHVLSRDRLLKEVWGYDYTGESNIIDVYVGYLRQKLEANNEPRVIQTVRGVGYVLREE